MTRKLLVPILLLVLLLVACSPDVVGTVEETAVPTALAIEAADESPPTASLSPTAVTATATVPPPATPAAEATVHLAGTSEPETVTPLTSPTSDPAELQVISGQTADGAFFLGAVEAPLTVIDYSDFL